MKYSQKIIMGIIFVIVSLMISYGVYAYEGMNHIKDKIIRLHVLANSNTNEDQSLKLHVRDQIISELSTELEAVSTKQDSERIILDELNLIKDIAEKTIEEEGYGYDVKVSYGNYEFPRKQYDDIVLPAGRYDAVRVEIGEAAGNNWWCVMFPAMCFVDFGATGKSEPVFDIDTEKKLREVLTDEEIESIKTTRGLEGIKLKSKVYELIEMGKIESSGLAAREKEKTYAVSK